MIRTPKLFAAALLTWSVIAVATPLAKAACPQTSLPAIQDEVMCPICGVPLVNAGGPQAEDERNFIRDLVDQCKSKEAIKTALIDEYGEDVLAVPKKSGFDLTAYLMPVVAGLAALVALVIGALRWRRARDGDAVAGSASGRSDAALDADLQRYDL